MDGHDESFGLDLRGFNRTHAQDGDVGNSL